MKGQIARVDVNAQTLTLEFDSDSIVGGPYSDTLVLSEPSKKLRGGRVAVTVLGFVEGRLVISLDGNPVTFGEVRSIFSPKLEPATVAGAVIGHTFHFGRA